MCSRLICLQFILFLILLTRNFRDKTVLKLTLRVSSFNLAFKVTEIHYS